MKEIFTILLLIIMVFIVILVIFWYLFYYPFRYSIFKNKIYIEKKRGTYELYGQHLSIAPSALYFLYHHEILDDIPRVIGGKSAYIKKATDMYLVAIIYLLYRQALKVTLDNKFSSSLLYVEKTNPNIYCEGLERQLLEVDFHSKSKIRLSSMIYKTSPYFFIVENWRYGVLANKVYLVKKGIASLEKQGIFDTFHFNIQVRKIFFQKEETTILLDALQQYKKDNQSLVESISQEIAQGIRIYEARSRRYSPYSRHDW